MTTTEKMNTTKGSPNGTNKLTARIADISLRKAAIVAGIGYLMSFIGASFATLYVDFGDAAATANNIKVGIFGFLIAILGDMLRAWALYVFFKQVNKSLALLSAWFMLVHDAIFGAALINLVFGSVLLSGAGHLTVFEPNQLHALRLLFLDGFNYGFQIGLFFFSFHLGILGYLVYKSGYIPRILSVLLIIASLGYLIDSVARLLLPNYPEIIWTILMGPCLIGELAIMVWLVIKGGKCPTDG